MNTAAKHPPGLPEHSVRFSRRAGRISLRVTPAKGLEVVLPAHLDVKEAEKIIPGLLRRHSAWIERNLRRLAPAGGDAAGGNALEEQGLFANAPARVLPEAVILDGGKERIPLLTARPDGRPVRATGVPGILECDWQPGPGGGNRGGLRSAPAHDLAALMRGCRGPETPGRALILSGDSPAAVFERLRLWLRREAEDRLGPALAELAERHGFVYRAARFRLQKSRWGSCSARGVINLNACLLFLPEAVAAYVLLHELCHTRQMNHSPAFWKEVFAIDPQALAKDRGLRKAWRHVPGWVFG